MTLPTLLAAVQTWDRSPSSADQLRAFAAQMALDATAGKAAPGDEQVLADLVKAYPAKDPATPAPASPITLSKAERCGKLLAPFLGDPKLGTWPYEDPFGLDDALAARWLRVLAPSAVVDDRARTLVTVLFGTRIRSVWVPAAEALGAFALRDEPSRAQLQALWAQSFPGGLKPGWPGGRIWGGQAVDGVDGTTMGHRARHVLAAAAAFVGGGGKLEGFTVEAVLKGAAPSGASDGSAFLITVRILLERGAVEPVQMWLKKHLPATPDDQAEDELREIVELLGDRESAAAVEAQLVAPKWKKRNGAEAADALWSWLATAVWMAARRRDLAGLHSMAGVAARALAMRLGEEVPEVEADPAAALAETIRALRDPIVWTTATAMRKAVLLVEARCLMERPDLAKVSLDAVMRRSGAPPGWSGTVGEAGLAALPLLLSRQEIRPPAMLLRSVALEKPAVLELARDRNGFVAKQVAVQVERLLRGTDDVGKVTLLWSLLLADPQDEVFAELEDVLRGDGTPLHALVAALRALDGARDKPGTKILDAYHAAVERHRPFLAGTVGGKGLALLCEVEHRLALGVERTAALPERVRALRITVLGPDNRSGLAGWRDWLGCPVSAGTAEALAAYEDAVIAAVSALQTPGAHEPPHLEALSTCWQGLDARLSQFVWPHELLIDRASYVPDALIGQLRVRRSAGVKAMAELGQHLGAHEEAHVLRLMRDHSALIAAGDPELLLRLRRFLLGQLLFREANQLQVLAPDERTQMWPFLSPLLPALGSGVFLLLGSAGNEIDAVVSPPADGFGLWPWAGLMVASGVGSCFALASALNMPRFTSAYGRLLVAFGATWGVAAAAAAVLLGALWFTGVHEQAFILQWLLWSSLSQFLGLFLSLVVQRMKLGEH